MTRRSRPDSTPHHCHTCGQHIWYLGTRKGWQHLRGRHNHPAHHHIANDNP